MASPQTIAMELVAALPGCRAGRFALEGNTVLTGRVMGWGPSLHRVGMAWAATPASMDAEGIAAAFEPYMAVQRRRIALAGTLGLDTAEQPDPGHLSFMVTDRLLLGWDEDLRAIAPRRLARLNQLSMPGRARFLKNGDLFVAEAGALREDDDPDPRPRLLYMNATHWGEYDGRSVIVHQPLPSSMLPSIAGRRLGDVVDLGTSEPGLAALADRTVTGADGHAGTTLLNTRPDWVPVPPPTRGEKA